MQIFWEWFLIFYQYGIAEQKYLLCERVYSLYIHRTEEFEYLFKGRGNWQRKLCYFELWYYALCGLSALLAFVKDSLMWITTPHFLWVVNFVSSVVLLSTPTLQIDTWVGRTRGNISHNEQKCGIANTEGTLWTYTENFSSGNDGDGAFQWKSCGFYDDHAS